MLSKNNKVRMISALVILVMIFSFANVGPAYAAPGDLDTSFDGDGIAFTPAIIQNGSDFGQSVVIQASAIQTDEKIVMAGYSETLNGIQSFTVVRYNNDGSLDTSFDTDGIVITSVGGYYDQAYSVALQPDGKIVVAGFSYATANNQYQFAVVRYNVDGSLDTSFDSDGIMTTDLAFLGGYYHVAYSIAIQSDSKIVVAGTTYSSSNYEFVVVRYNDDGSLDTSFNGDGILTTNPGGTYSSAKSVAIQSDGQIVVAGSTYGSATNNQWKFGVVRLNASNGSLDTSFDGDGIMTTSVGGNYDQANSVAIQSDGQIVVAGFGYAPPYYYEIQFAVVRLNGSDGSLDTTFDADGKVNTNVSGGYGYQNQAKSIAIQSDGKIVVAGTANGPATNYRNQFGVVRYNSDGSLDASFDTDGIVITGVNGDDDQANAVAIQSDGKIVVGGFANNPILSESDFAVVRYNTDGTLDSAFDNDGMVTTNIGMRQQSLPAYGIAIQSDGKIVLAGRMYSGNISQFMVARFNPNGSLDTSFDTDGMATFAVGDYSYASAVAIQTDGQIVVAGSAYGTITNYQWQFAVVRLNGSDGSFDTSFDSDGVALANPGGDYGYASSVAIQSDGQIVAAGYASGSVTNYQAQFSVVRLNASDGSLDTSFDDDGMMTASVSGSYDQANSVAIQNDGRIVVAGNTYGPATNYQNQFGVMRLNGSDGSLDTSFDGDGIMTIGASGYVDQAYSVAIQGDGQIVVAGYSYGPPNYNSQFELVRLNGSDGSLDTSFDGDGIVTTGVGGISDQAYSVAIQSDGQIVAAGYSYGPATNYQNQFGVVRLNGTDGSLDTSFNTDGIAYTSAGGEYASAYAVAIQTDGKIVVGGESQSANSNAVNGTVVRFDGSSVPTDVTAPTATPTQSPPSNAAGWNNSDVTVDWNWADESGGSGIDAGNCTTSSASSGEGNITLNATCKDLAGNEGNASYSVMVDKTLPDVSLVGGPADGGSYYFGFVPAAPTCTASDALSGLDGSCVVSNYSALVGPHTVTATAEDMADNVNNASASYTVLAWTANGFFSPVDMGGVWNTVKGGSTVPLKFEVFAGSSELTDPAIVVQPLKATQSMCSGGPSDEIELTTTGATSLRYDATSGQFIYNWKTPKKPGYCYVVTVTLADGTTISANFVLK